MQRVVTEQEACGRRREIGIGALAVMRRDDGLGRVFACEPGANGRRTGIEHYGIYFIWDRQVGAQTLL